MQRSDNDFRIENGVLAGYYGKETDVAVPEGVTAIGSYAFSDNDKLEVVVLPLSVVKIDYCAFLNCPRLLGVLLSAGLDEIGDYAFRNCEKLECAEFPSGLRKIGKYAFWNCRRLKNLKINADLEEFGEGAFEGTSGVESISADPENKYYYAEGNCLIRKKDNAVILGCRNSVIPENKEITIIGSNAFSGQQNLKEIRMGDNIRLVEERAFMSCTGLERIIVDKANKNYYSEGNCLIDRAEGSVILGCGSSRLPSDGSISVIGLFSFRGCGISGIRIPEGVFLIRSLAFGQCEKLEYVIFPKSMEHIASHAFCDDKNLKAVFFESETEIDDDEVIGEENDELYFCDWYYYSVKKPDRPGKFWHYGEDGETPVIWE